MDDQLLRFDDDRLHDRVGQLVRDARLLTGWSQQELAARAGTSQAVVSRLENGRSPVLDLDVIARMLAALGIRGGLGIDARHLADRARQRDPVHARIVGYVARRLERAGWRTATEVQIGEPVPRGWIDVLAYREDDAAGLMIEVKGEVRDMGALQRQVGFYARMAPAAARPLGWHIEHLSVAVVALDSRAIADRLVENASLVRRVFPGVVAHLLDWIDGASSNPPAGPTLALADPASRRARWLRTTPLDRRRLPASYVDYADAARRLRRS